MGGSILFPTPLGIMAHPASLQRTNGKYMWFALLGLGFDADTVASSIAKSNLSVRPVNLGPTMFDKPNKDASYIVIHFLLAKLNPTRFQDAYRHCWPVTNHKADAEFRKVTCAWLKEIMDETGNAGSKVVASLFLTPGGSKFIALMLNLANHVMLQEMKSFRTGDSWVPEAAAKPASSVDTAARRLSLASKKFLKTAVDQDRFLQEYQRRAQLLVKSTRDVREEVAKYNDLLKNYSSESALEGVSPSEKSKKVRSLWSSIDQMLSATKEEQNAVGSVLQGAVDQCILDGTDRGLNVPRSLLERIEQLPHQLSSGNVYEDGQLNLLCVMELLTHALQIFRDERGRASVANRPQLSPRRLRDKCRQTARVLQELHLIRQKISKEKLPDFRSSIRELEAEWDRKWKDCLEDTPLVSFLNEDPALGFLSPMVPLSFKPATGANDRSGVFSQYRAKLLEETSAEDEVHQVIDPTFSDTKNSCSATHERTASPVGATAPSRANTSLDWLFDTPPSPPQKAAPVAPPQASVGTTTPVPSKVVTRKTKTRILDLECDNLADQFADAVTTTIQTDARVKGLDLEGLLSNLHVDPFSTRKQLTRTPESLIMDVKSSWRKAVEEDKAEKIRRSAEVNESLTRRVTSFRESREAPAGSVAPSWNGSYAFTPTATSHNQPCVGQRGVPLKSTLIWDTFNGDDALDSSSDASASAAQFTLDHETLPELPSCDDSLLSVDGDALEADDVLLALSPNGEPSPTRSLLRPWQACDDGPLAKSTERTPECLLTGDFGSGLDVDWLKEPVKSDNVFSLDLDTLETQSPPKTQEYSLPKLITFSPIDDMKC